MLEDMKNYATADWMRKLERAGELVRVREQLSSDLEIAALQQRLFRMGAPAVLVEHVEGSRYPALANLYGTPERMERLLGRAREGVEALVAASRNPMALLKRPSLWFAALRAAGCALPCEVNEPTAPWEPVPLDRIPGVRCWPEDGGRFWTLPQVYSEDPARPGLLRSNLGMYRVQLDGNSYRGDAVGLHYQLRRGIGAHHQTAMARGEALKVSVFLGGHPAHALAAVMPLPEGMPEIAAAGALAGRRFRYFRRDGWLHSADADFVLTGTVLPGERLPEGPFGDHMGYYSLRHEMPVLHVTGAWARRDAIFPFTVVGRPPQEDSLFGAFVHRLTADAVPARLPGVRAVNAVDEAGVHPLLLALGSERDVPYEETKPRELLAQARAVLGFGQLSLAKVLVIADGARGDAPGPDDVSGFLRHALERADWRRDLHFFTRGDADTLDYAGGELHSGSKCVWAVAGKPTRALAAELPSAFQGTLGEFGGARLAAPGVVALEGPKWTSADAARREIAALEAALAPRDPAALRSVPVVALVDDVADASASRRDLLWTVFTRIDPARDVFGVGESTEDKHWGCDGPLILDARSKPHHAPVVLPDPAAEERIDRLFARGGSLYGLGIRS